MYGTFAGMSFGLVAFVALLVIALAVFASPLLAILLVAAIGLLLGMSALRQRSERADRTPGGASDTREDVEGPHSHGGGAPVSGEG
jgi:hypothetical protein